MTETTLHKNFRKLSFTGQGRVHKYRVADSFLRTDRTGRVFDSKKEMERYITLQLIEKQGLIKNLKCQEPFVLQESFISKQYGNIREIKYIADFTYLDNGYNEGALGRWCTEDVKGFKTKDYLIKRKLFLYQFADWLFFEI
jgi:hypothetical protein